MPNSSKYKIKNATIIFSLIGALLINNFIISLKKKNNISNQAYLYESIQDYTLNDIKNLVYTSPYLSEEEKTYLYNEDFINDILPLINETVISRIRCKRHFNNIRISTYGSDDTGKDYAGYYNPIFPSSIFIKDYDDINASRDTIAHEFIHLCQNINTYNLITEASAEIISYEYFDGCYMSVYTKQVQVLKKIMEIIGPELIWNFNFTGDFKPIEESISPYLTPEEYNEFLSCLSFKDSNSDDANEKIEKLNKLLAILYKNMNGCIIEDNEIISAIDNSDCRMTRYYFNKRLINQENSYYIDFSNKELSQMSYEEAMDMNLFKAYAVKYENITQEEALDYLQNGNRYIYRRINFSKNNIIIKAQKSDDIGLFINGTIDGKEYKNANVDELAAEGIIDINYCYISLKTLTAEEYLNKKCDEGYHIFTLYSSKELKLYDDYIEGYIPKKVYVTPINETGYTYTLEPNNFNK